MKNSLTIGWPPRRDEHWWRGGAELHRAPQVRRARVGLPWGHAEGTPTRLENALAPVLASHVCFHAGTPQILFVIIISTQYCISCVFCCCCDE